MNAGFFRRALALTADFILILAIVFFTFRFVARPIYAARTDNFHDLNERYQEVEEAYREALMAIEDAFFDNEIDEEERELQRRNLTESFYEDFPDEMAFRDNYLGFQWFYHVFAFLVFHTLYMLATKGHSFGRKLARIRLAGHVNVLSILLRELFWKYLLWVIGVLFAYGTGSYVLLMLGVTSIFADIFMSMLTHNRKILRDYLTRTRVILDDIVYPF
ncbi:MAG: hypothetical protein EA374_07005 [Acholeplasmatales bacterium]|nr:MAG: hypothetical protein EA374_07005 [Acholeplasmatales bacterium]